MGKRKASQSNPFDNPTAKENPSISSSGSNFFEDVHDVVRQIPAGRVTSYGAIAKYLGTGLSARMVGWAMNASHRALNPVPAHRVVNRKGMLSGKMHFQTPGQMEDRLMSEGVQVSDDQVMDLERHFWDPSSELAI